MHLNHFWSSGYSKAPAYASLQEPSLLHLMDFLHTSSAKGASGMIRCATDQKRHTRRVNIFQSVLIFNFRFDTFTLILIPSFHSAANLLQEAVGPENMSQVPRVGCTVRIISLQMDMISNFWSHTIPRHVTWGVLLLAASVYYDAGSALTLVPK